MMNPSEPDDDLNRLIDTLETIEIDRLKHVSYKKYASQLSKLCKKSLSVDGSRLNIIIQHIKTNKDPSFRRDVVIDLLAGLVINDLLPILKEPFGKTSSAQWNDLACSIAAVPDLLANCNAIERYPDLLPEPYYNRLADQVYAAVECKSSTGKFVQTEYKLFLLKLLGRISLAGHSLTVWNKFTRRAIHEPRSNVRQLCSDIIRLSIKPPTEFAALELFIDYLTIPIFSNLKPYDNSGQLIKHILGASLEESEHLQYLICNKSIFKTNYQLPKERQAIILFNIAAYMSSLVIPQQNDFDDTNKQKTSLLTKTLLEIVESWTNPTKILIRTYQHTKFIAYALLVFFRYASKYDNKQLADHANKIQSMIVDCIPTYLNRANEQQRNIACCICKLVLPKLRDILLDKQQGSLAKSGQHEKPELDFKFDLDDDLLYLHRLFDQDVEVLFQDVFDTTNEAIDTSNKVTGVTVSVTRQSDHAVNDVKVNSRQLSDKQLQDQTNDLNIDNNYGTINCRSSSNGRGVSVVSLDRKCAIKATKSKISDIDDDDLIPYDVSEDDDDNPDDDDDEIEMSSEARRVPIYLRDCINGLIENNNHRFVRLCLIKAATLIDEMIKQEEHDAGSRNNDSVCLAARPDERPLSRAFTGEHHDRHKPKQHDVNDTIKDVGVELARTLLFLENQYNISEFDDYRMNCLVSLCFAAPGLIGKYLVDELNATNRSIRQQLDILNVLVTTAYKLSFGSVPKGLSDEFCMAKDKRLVVLISSKYRKKHEKINRFAPYAGLFFYGISHRLKADLQSADSLIVSRPESVMSAFRNNNRNKNEIDLLRPNSVDELDIVLKTTTTGRISRGNRKGFKQMVLLSADDDEQDKDLRRAKETIEDLGRNSVSDDSYLLSRILLSISSILNCSAQQPVTCKLSSDLLDILSAYRCHPDSGVQRAIVSCLNMIRDCTPSTYYREYIEKRMLRSFGPWLAKNESNIQR
jgi:hypothetical protein